MTFSKLHIRGFLKVSLGILWVQQLIIWSCGQDQEGMTSYITIVCVFLHPQLQEIINSYHFQANFWLL